MNHNTLDMAHNKSPKQRSLEEKVKPKECHRPGPAASLKPSGLIPLLNLDEVKNTEKVVLVENENLIRILKELKIVATSQPGRLRDINSIDWTPLENKKIFLLPCNNLNSKTIMEEVGDILKEKIKDLFWIEPGDQGFGEKEHNFDYFRDEGYISRFFEREIPFFSKDLYKHYQNIIDGNYKVLPLPWEILNVATGGFRPGGINILCGQPSSSKSFFILQILIFLHQKGEKVCALELEGNLVSHLSRALAQTSENPNLLKEEFIKKNEKKIMEILDSSKTFHSSFAKCIHEWDIKKYPSVNFENLLKYVEDCVQKKFKLIVIDPITAVSQNNNQYVDEQNFILQVESIIKNSKSSLVLVTHPKKGATEPHQDNIGGSTAFVRFTEGVQWIEIKEIDISLDNGTSQLTNRIIHVLKARNSPGTGLSIGYRFNDYLKFEELGIVS